MRRLLWLALLFAPGAFAYDYVRTINTVASTDTDTRGFVPYLKQTFPTINIDEGSNYSENWRDYIACGDDTVTTSPVYGDINPVWSTSGTPPETKTLTQTDANNPVFSIATAIQGTNSWHTICTNAVGSLNVTRANWTVNDTGGGAVGPEVIPQGGHSYFVDCATGNDAFAGNTILLPLRTLAGASAKATVAGDDIWLKGGCDFSGTGISASGVWSYTVPGGVDDTTDREIIGSYYVSGSVAYVNFPTNWTAYRRESEYTYTATPPIIDGSFQQSCRVSDGADGSKFVQTLATGLPVSGKCALGTAANYFSGSQGNYGPGGTAAVPTNPNNALVTLTFGNSKKYVTLQDIRIRGSAGIGLLAQMSTPTICYGDTTCKTEFIGQRLEIDHVGSQPGQTNGMSRTAFRYIYLHEAKLGYADQIFGQNRGGGGITATNCAPCEMLQEAFDTNYMYNESSGQYGVSHVLTRGFFVGSHSLSGGSNSDEVQEQNILIGTVPVHIAPSTIGVYPFWSLSHEHHGFKGGPPAFQNAATRMGSQIVRRNNIIVTGKSNALYHTADVASNASSGGPFFSTFVSDWDVGNTVIVGSQSQPIYFSFRNMDAGCGELGEDSYAGPVGGASHNGCRSRPASFLNTYKVKNNLFVVQSGYTQTSAWCQFVQGTLGTASFDYNQFTRAPDSTCVGAHDVVSATTGLPVVDWISNEWTGSTFPLEDITNFTPSGGAGANAGTPLDTNDGAIDTGTEWDWVLAQRVWLPQCNTTGAQVSKTEWLKVDTTDYCGNPRSATVPDVGAVEH